MRWNKHKILLKFIKSIFVKLQSKENHNFVHDIYSETIQVKPIHFLHFKSFNLLKETYFLYQSSLTKSVDPALIIQFLAIPLTAQTVRAILGVQLIAFTHCCA